MARAIPRIIPITIDSNVNPGMGGMASGSELRVEVEVGDAVTVVESVLDSTEVTVLDVLTTDVDCVRAVVKLIEVGTVLLLVTVVAWFRVGSTANEAVAESPICPPVTLTAYTAAVTLAATNEPVTIPPEIVQTGDEMDPLLPAIVQVESVKAKPEPDTVTVAPAGADEGLSVTAGPLIVKVVEAESLPGLPKAVIG